MEEYYSFQNENKPKTLRMISRLKCARKQWEKYKVSFEEVVNTINSQNGMSGISLQKRRKLKVMKDQQRAHTAIRNRRKQMLQKEDEIESAMNSDRSIVTNRLNAKHNIASQDFSATFS